MMLRMEVMFLTRLKSKNKVFPVLKWFCLVVSPAFCTLYLTLASIWQLPYAESIVATVSAFTVFLGALLGLNSTDNKE